jgi:hypothetical protein
MLETVQGSLGRLQGFEISGFCAWDLFRASIFEFRIWRGGTRCVTLVSMGGARWLSGRV